MKHGTRTHSCTDFLGIPSDRDAACPHAGPGARPSWPFRPVVDKRSLELAEDRATCVSTNRSLAFAFLRKRGDQPSRLSGTILRKSVLFSGFVTHRPSFHVLLIHKKHSQQAFSGHLGIWELSSPPFKCTNIIDAISVQKTSFLDATVFLRENKFVILVSRRGAARLAELAQEGRLRIERVAVLKAEREAFLVCRWKRVRVGGQKN